MRLLIFTQKVDKKDSILGFVHTWIEELSLSFESIEVICLYKGEYNLPKNVTVYSLGKEKNSSKFGYVLNLYKYLYLISGSYDKVFVHMNEEYVLLAGLYWKLKNIPVYMWRNHPKGSFLTKLAILMCTKAFCTSTASFTARFKKTVIMPAGNDNNFFKPVPGVIRKKNSVCMLGRVAPIKHPELALEAINYLVKGGEQISLSIIGSPIDKDITYYQSLKKYVIDKELSSYVTFVQEVPFEKHPEEFSGYEVNLNLTDSGSFDKTIIGGTSCGAIPLVSNSSLRGILPEVCVTTTSPKDIADSIKRLLNPHEQIKIQDDLKRFVESQSLASLINKLSIEMK